MQPVERARLDQRLEQAAVEDAAAGARGEVEDVGERAAGGALGDQRIDRLDADAADRGQRIADRAAVRAVLDGELGAAVVDVGRPELDADPRDLLAVEVELVLIGAVHRHRRGEELDRVVGLEIGGLVGEQRVGGGVRLVEAVAGELRDLLEDRGRELLRDLCARPRPRRRSRAAASISALIFLPIARRRRSAPPSE